MLAFYQQLRAARHLQTFIFIGICLYLAIHLFFLHHTPVGGGEDKMFASATYEYLTTNKLIISVSKEVTATTVGNKKYEEALYYGYNYFYLQAQIAKLIGTNRYQFHLLNFFFYVIVAVLHMNFARKAMQLSVFASIFIGIFFLTDVVVMQQLYSGRMDSMAMAAILLAAYLYFAYRSYQLDTWQFHIIRLALVVLSFLAMTTTPRIGMTLAALGLAIVYDTWLQKNAKIYLFNALYLAGIPLLYWLGWIVPQFGDVLTFAKYMTSGTPSRQIITSGWDIVFRFDIFRSSFHLPLFAVIIAYMGLLLWNFFRKDTKNKTSQANVFANPAIPLHIFLLASVVIHTKIALAGYVQMVVGYLYLWLLYVGTHTQGWGIAYKRLFIGGCTLLMATNLVGNCLKLTSEIILWDKKDSAKAEAFIRKNIPPHTPVMASLNYYYLLQKNSCKIEATELVLNFDRVRTEFDFEYILFADELTWRNRPLALYAPDTFQLIDSLKLSSGYPPTIEKFATKFQILRGGNYNGYLYKRIKAK